MKSVLVCSLLFVSLSAHADALCRPSADVQRYIDVEHARPDEGDSLLVGKRRLAALAVLRAAHPTDPHVLAEYYEVYDEDLDDLAGFRALLTDARAHGLDEAEALVFDGKLAGSDTKAAEAAYLAALAKSPKNPRANLELGLLYAQLDDKKRAKRQLLAGILECPTERAYYAVARLREPGLADLLAIGLRAHVEHTEDERELGLYPVLWRTALALPNRAAAARKQIAIDLARIERLGGEKSSLRVLDILEKGQNFLGDKVAKQATIDLRAKLYPSSRQTIDDVITTWQHASMMDQPKTPEARLAKATKSRELAKAWTTRWPDSLSAWNVWLSALLRLPDVQPAEVERVSNRLVELHDDDFGGLAYLYIRFGVHVDRIPGLVQRARDRSLRERHRRERQIGVSKSARDMMHMGEQFDRVSTDDMLVRAQLKLGHNAEAKQVLADLDTIAAQPIAADADEMAKEVQSEATTAVAHARGHIALAEGHKADALALFLQTIAMDTEPTRDPPDPLDDDERKDAEQTFLALGGTKASYALLPKSLPSKGAPKEDPSWKPVDRPMTNFMLPDLAGKTWRLRDLAGKAVVVVMWATWCGPCKMEMPDVKALAQKLAGRKDAVLLSVTVDEEAGLVAPFVAENHITYPVLFGASVSKTLNTTGGIPYAMIIDKKGHVRAESRGYNLEAAPGQWVDAALAVIEKSR